MLSDWLVVRVTVNPGRSLPRPHDLHGRGRAAAEDAERDRADDPAGQDDAGVPARHGDAAAVLDLQRRGRQGRHAGHDHGAGRAAGVPDPDDHRRAALGDRPGRHRPHAARQRHRHLRPRGRSRRRLRRAAARQDRHDHARQPPGLRVLPAGRRHRAGARRRRAARSLGDETPEGRASSCSPSAPSASCRRALELRAVHVRAVLRADAHERRRPSGARDPQGRARRDPRLDRAAGRAHRRRSRSTRVDNVARRGSTPLVVAEGAQVLGVIELKDIVKSASRSASPSCAAWASAPS